MPNIKSAKKRVLVTEKKTLENKAIKSALKTQIKKFLAAVNAGDKELAENRFRRFQGHSAQEQRREQEGKARKEARLACRIT